MSEAAMHDSNYILFHVQARFIFEIKAKALIALPNLTIIIYMYRKISLTLNNTIFYRLNFKLDQNVHSHSPHTHVMTLAYRLLIF